MASVRGNHPSAAVTVDAGTSAPPRGRRPRTHETKALIVEDEELIALDMKLVLEGMGILVTGIAFSPSEALAGIEATRPDLVLVDLSLGGRFDGIELARAIQDRGNAGVLLISGHFGDTAVAGLEHIRVAGYLAKPFYPVNLREAVEAALSNQGR